MDDYYNSYASHPVLWQSGIFAQELHEWFLDKYLKTGRWEELHLGKKEMAMSRFSINSVLWFGEEMRKFAGIVPGDDEEFLSCIYPTRQGVSNAWNGDAIVAHFAFFTQREQLDQLHILERYGEICKQEFMASEEFRKYYEGVQEAMEYVQEHEAELMQRQSPYRSVQVKKTLRSRIKSYLPEIIQEFLVLRYDRKQKSGFIVE